MQRLRAAGLTIALLLLSGSAWAGCSERDLEGTYDLTAESKGDYGTITTTCEIGVTGQGTVLSGAACLQRNGEGAESEARVDGGEISVARSCEVTGQVMIDGYRSVITEARMSNDKHMVAGKGTNALDGSPLSFTATRQVAAVEQEDEGGGVFSWKRWKRWFSWLL